MCSERKHGLSAAKKSVSAYVGSSKALTDLKDAAAFVARCRVAQASAVYGGAYYTFSCDYHGSTCGTCIPIFVSI